MLFPRTVASLAALPLDAVVLVEHCLPVRPAIIGLPYLLMTGLAGICTYILRWIGGVIGNVGLPARLIRLLVFGLCVTGAGLCAVLR